MKTLEQLQPTAPKPLLIHDKHQQTEETLNSYIQSLDETIRVKQQQLRHLKEQQHYKCKTVNIFQLPSSLPPAVAPPSAKSLALVCSYLTQRHEQRAKQELAQEKKRKRCQDNWKREQDMKRRRISLKQRQQRELFDLKLVSDIHKLSEGSRSCERHLRALRREETINKHGDVKKIAIVPPFKPLNQPVVDVSNNKIQDPLEYYYNHSKYINPWTINERYSFLKLFCQYGKQFSIISSFFRYKSVGDVIQFYYQNKLHYGLHQLRSRIEQGDHIENNEILSLAWRGIICSNMKFNEHENDDDVHPGSTSDGSSESSTEIVVDEYREEQIGKEEIEGGGNGSVMSIKEETKDVPDVVKVKESVPNQCPSIQFSSKHMSLTSAKWIPNAAIGIQKARSIVL